MICDKKKRYTLQLLNVTFMQMLSIILLCEVYVIQIHIPHNLAKQGTLHSALTPHQKVSTFFGRRQNLIINSTIVLFLDKYIFCKNIPFSLSYSSVYHFWLSLEI